LGTIFYFFRRRAWFFYMALVSILLPGCISTKRLQENQKLLYRQTLKLPKGINKDAVRELLVQKPNSRFGLAVPMYYIGKKKFRKEKFIAKRNKLEAKFDKRIAAATQQRRIDNLQYRKQNKLDVINKKITNGNLFMQWGDSLVVFDTAAMKKSVGKIESYLFNKGYFQRKVSAAYEEIKPRKIEVTYTLEPGPIYLIDSIFYHIPDAKVAAIVKQHAAESLLRKGEAYDQENLTKERDRIDLLLKDEGFYDFSKQFIDYALDTAQHPRKVLLQMEILNPSKRGYHKQFVIDSVNFTTDVGVTGHENEKRVNVPYENLNFHFFRDEYSKKILAQRVFLNKDSLYSRTKTFDTQRQLANLDNFKFVNINYDTSRGRFIANIFASPLDRYTWGNEAGMTVTQGFPGPYVSTNFKKRNFLGGLELLEINGRFGFEGVASVTSQGNFYKSTEANLNASITFPQFLFPFRKAASFRYAKNNPRTKILVGYTYTDRPEYQRAITTVSATYTWDLKRRLQFSFSPATLNIIRSDTSAAFGEQLRKFQEQGNNLINAFKPSYVSSMIFTLTWNNGYGTNQKNSTLIRTSLESGGTLLNFYSPAIIQNQGLQPYQYVRFSFDFRQNKVINKRTSLAYRFNSGIGYAYSSNRVLPYEKNFFAGGSNSVRAWRPRRLGIGSDPPPVSGSISSNGYFDYRFEKPGELLLEGSIEWRQKLIGFLNYALFVDAGNVWSLRTTSNQNAQFEWNRFYSEFGVGTGFGLRFDFSFLILRLDVGVKAWDPAREAGQRFVLPNAAFWGPYSTTREPVIYNIGIGYPF
jgi:outer membrane protein assembly factor BamA